MNRLRHCCASITPQPASPTVKPHPAGPASLVLGTWVYPTPNSANTLSRLEITGNGTQLSIHAWGACAGCDWGVQSTTFYGQEATVKYAFTTPMNGEAAGRVTAVSLSLDGDKLAVTTSSTYPDRKPTRRQVDFTRGQ